MAIKFIESITKYFDDQIAFLEEYNKSDLKRSEILATVIVLLRLKSYILYIREPEGKAFFLFETMKINFLRNLYLYQEYFIYFFFPVLV